MVFTMTTDHVMQARESAVVTVDGVACRVRRARTLAHPDARIVREHPELFRVLPLDYTADPDTADASGAAEPAAGDAESADAAGSGAGDEADPAPAAATPAKRARKRARPKTAPEA